MAEYADGFFQLAGIGMKLDYQRTAIGCWGCNLFVVGTDGNIGKLSQEKVPG